MLFFICAWTNGWANNRDVGDLRCHRVGGVGGWWWGRGSCFHGDEFPTNYATSTLRNSLQWRHKQCDGVSNTGVQSVCSTVWRNVVIQMRLGYRQFYICNCVYVKNILTWQNNTDVLTFYISSDVQWKTLLHDILPYKVLSILNSHRMALFGFCVCCTPDVQYGILILWLSRHWFNEPTLSLPQSSIQKVHEFITYSTFSKHFVGLSSVNNIMAFFTHVNTIMVFSGM